MKNIINIILLFFIVLNTNGQSIDRVEAIIGGEVILTSDYESQYAQYLSQGNIKSDIVKCQFIEDVLFQKLLINQAKIDSLLVTDEEVESEILKRIQYFESQLGSLEKVLDYFGKSKSEIEIELGKVIRNQFLAQKAQSEISSNINVTPYEVSEFFRTLSKSEIPIIPEQVEMKQIIIEPFISDIESNKLRAKLNSFRERVISGEDFKMLATLYSDDPISASRGGELGFVNRGDLVPEFERAAFRLKNNEISEVVKSQFGFHIIQLIERRGEQINVRHILLKNKVTSTQLYNTKLKIDSIKKYIDSNTISFDDAITKYSSDDGKNNGGFLLNQNTMSTMHSVNDLDNTLKFSIQKLKIDELSSPLLFELQDGNQAYRIIKVTNKIESHEANLIDDFAIIQELAVKEKIQNKISVWIDDNISKTYIKINENISECKFQNKWIN